MDLKAVKTSDLISELENRDGVKRITVGPYQSYDLNKKFSKDGTRELVKADVVLIIEDLGQVDIR